MEGGPGLGDVQRANKGEAGRRRDRCNCRALQRRCSLPRWLIMAFSFHWESQDAPGLPDCSVVDFWPAWLRQQEKAGGRRLPAPVFCSHLQQHTNIA